MLSGEEANTSPITYMTLHSMFIFYVFIGIFLFQASVFFAFATNFGDFVIGPRGGRK